MLFGDVVPVKITSTELYAIVTNTQTQLIRVKLKDGKIYTFKRANNTMYFSSIVKALQDQELVFSYALTKDAILEIDYKVMQIR